MEKRGCALARARARTRALGRGCFLTEKEWGAGRERADWSAAFAAVRQAKPQPDGTVPGRALEKARPGRRGAANKQSSEHGAAGGGVKVRGASRPAGPSVRGAVVFTALHPRSAHRSMEQALPGR